MDPFVLSRYLQNQSQISYLKPLKVTFESPTLKIKEIGFILHPYDAYQLPPGSHKFAAVAIISNTKSIIPTSLFLTEVTPQRSVIRHPHDTEYFHIN